jgi:hypothetical protein
MHPAFKISSKKKKKNVLQIKKMYFIYSNVYKIRHFKVLYTTNDRHNSNKNL